MSDDLVKRLRTWKMLEPATNNLCARAAVRIEALENQLQQRALEYLSLELKRLRPAWEQRIEADRAAMQQALEALEAANECHVWPRQIKEACGVAAAIEALRERLK